jgi:hypothetical protein
MELYSLHPIFEFFLVLYTGYLVSTDTIKAMIDERLNPFQDIYIKLIKERKDLFLKQIKEIKEQRDTSEIGKIITRQVGTDDGARQIFDNYHKPKISQLDELEKEINNYEKPAFDPEFKTESQFMNVLKPYSLFFSLFCFAILFINSYPPFLTDDRFYGALWFFNGVSFLFIGAIFGISFYKNHFPKWLTFFCTHKKIKTIFVLLLFLLTLLISIIAFFNYDTISKCGIMLFFRNYILSEYWKNYAIIGSVFIALLPILIYIFRLQLDAKKTSQELEAKWTEKFNNDFNPRLTVIKNAFNNPESLMIQLNNYFESKENGLKEKKSTPPA